MRICFALILLLAVASCRPASEGLPVDVGDDHLSGRIVVADEGFFDFGSVLAQDQILRHEFTLRNLSARPVRLLGSEAQVPCCSAIEPIPPVIPAGREVRVGVTLKAGRKAEQKRIGFEVTTDSAEWPQIAFSVGARLLPDWEVKATEAPSDQVPTGESHRCSFRIICRGRMGEGLAAPEAIETAGGLRLGSVGPLVPITSDQGFIAVARDVVASQAARAEVGWNRGELTWRWHDEARTHAVQWQVAARLRLSPESLVFDTSSGSREAKVTIQRSSRPESRSGCSGSRAPRSPARPS